MKKKYKLLFAGVLAVLAAAYALYATTRPVDVLCEPLTAGPMGDSFTAQGTLEPTQSLVVTSAASGAVSVLPVRVGSRVLAGDTLAELDNSAIREELASQVASLKLQKNASAAESAIRREQVRVQLESAEIEYYRQYGPEVGSAAAVSDLALSNYLQARSAFQDAEDMNDSAPGVTSVRPVSGRELYQLEQQMIAARKSFIISRNSTDDTNKAYYIALIDSYKAQLGLLGSYSEQQLQATIDYLEGKLNRTSVTAPLDGVVWETYVAPGSLVTESAPVVRIFPDGGPMKLTAKLLSEDATALEVGDTAECALTDGSSFTAEVSFVSPVAEQSLSAIGLAENRCGVELIPIGLPPQAGAGFQADLTFRSVAAAAALSVPSSALLPTPTGSAVYLSRDGKATLTPVETGLRVGGRVELLAGAAEGDTVIINPADSGVKNGSRVKAG